MYAMDDFVRHSAQHTQMRGTAQPSLPSAVRPLRMLMMIPVVRL